MLTRQEEQKLNFIFEDLKSEIGFFHSGFHVLHEKKVGKPEIIYRGLSFRHIGIYVLIKPRTKPMINPPKYPF